MPWLTSAQAAAHLGISTRHLQRLIAKGLIPFSRLKGQGHPKFKMEDLDRLMLPGSDANQATELKAFIKESTTETEP